MGVKESPSVRTRRNPGLLVVKWPGVRTALVSGGQMFLGNLLAGGDLGGSH